MSHAHQFSTSFEFSSYTALIVITNLISLLPTVVNLTKFTIFKGVPENPWSYCHRCCLLNMNVCHILSRLLGDLLTLWLWWMHSKLLLVHWLLYLGLSSILHWILAIWHWSCHSWKLHSHIPHVHTWLLHLGWHHHWSTSRHCGYTSHLLLGIRIALGLLAWVRLLLHLDISWHAIWTTIHFQEEYN